ncbi:recombinase family protein [Erythrobacter sp. Alg231-14]|uniref:recombinase family protein n=1 Tax=Erythrobacter sp. Alg231-14 TaxID=1922225 RepID=UPI000D54EA59
MKTVRCAIYTRKSSEEGLEQDFNSLDAQREACAAYVLSQASEGWKLLPDQYDDGGLSGGSLERPALQRLLGDVRDGRVDIIVVYKVDRLTRSLLDFAKLVEAFDAAQVSFVSVTQSFNTTTSMGRLTLNMLLSFAQFEREVTAERIRDKIAASKAKGMWMGGVPPLGYEPDGRSLKVVPKHADVVRKIYRLYRAEKNVRRVSERLIERGVSSPVRRAATGKTYGGGRISQGQLYTILKNPVYAGNIGHKDKVYPGNHSAIIDQDEWDAVQKQLAANTQGIRRQRESSRALLAGLLFDQDGRPLKPVHATKGVKRYRYYIGESQKCSDGESRSSTLRIPALEIERLVHTEVETLIADPLSLATIARITVRPSSLAMLQANNLETRTKRATVERFVDRVTVHTDRIVLALSTSAITELLEAANGATAKTAAEHTIPVSLKRSGLAVRLISSDGSHANDVGPDASLVRLIAQANIWWSALAGGQTDVASLAREKGITPSWMTRVIRLAFLAPEVVEAILEGKIKATTSRRRLLAADGVSASWRE